MIEKDQYYRVRPVFARGDGSGVVPAMVGRVSYVHPKGRFATLEFTGPGGVSWECFWPEDLTERNLMRQSGRT